MDRNYLDECIDGNQSYDLNNSDSYERCYVNLETEIPEVLYSGMKKFIEENPNWNQYRLMSSAIASFLFQNGSGDRAVTERYLNDLFTRSNA